MSLEVLKTKIKGGGDFVMELLEWRFEFLSAKIGMRQSVKLSCYLIERLCYVVLARRAESGN